MFPTLLVLGAVRPATPMSGGPIFKSKSGSLPLMVFQSVAHYWQWLTHYVVTRGTALRPPSTAMWSSRVPCFAFLSYVIHQQR